MKKHRLLAAKIFSTLFLFAILSTSVISGFEASSGASAVQPRNKPVVIFALAGEPDEYHMDAVVVVNGKRLLAPFTDEQKARQKKFAETYFATGRTYRLTFGGGAAGSVTLKKWSEGCNTIHAEVALSASARLGGNVRALATNSETLGKKLSARRAPTDAERSGMMLLMKTIYTQHRTPLNLIPAIKVTNLTATDLDGDGAYEMIGSFTLAAANKFERDLFLIARPQGRAMRADFVKFKAYQPPPEEFLSSIDFVDQLDLNGDGIGEVFAVQGGFDAYAYVIFKKVGGRWKQVYDTIGDVC